MSAIAGVIGAGDSSGHRTNAMLAALAHRYTGDPRVVRSPAAELGHGARPTTPEALAEKQPLTLGPTGPTITADVRLDNRPELMRDLGLDPADARTDVDLLGAAWERWHERCVDHLIGDFAFAIWEEAAGRLFCARDHLGVRPLFYWHRDGIFAFASEAAGLLALEDIDRVVSEQFVADQLAHIWGDREVTPLEGIRRLPPASSLVFDKSTASVMVSGYWSPDSALELQLDSDAEYEAEFTRILERAVSDRLRSTQPVAAHLSGGLDSAAVALTAQRIAGDQDLGSVHTLSLVFEEVPEVDETEFIDAMATVGPLRHDIAGDAHGPLADLPALFERWDTPVFGPSHQYVYHLSREARAVGCGVVLDGFDGDTVFSHGYERLSELAAQGDWATFHSEAVALEANGIGTALGHLQLRGLPAIDAMVRSGQLAAGARAARSIARLFDMPRSAVVKRLALVAASALRRRIRPRPGDRSPGTPKVAPLASSAAIDRLHLCDRIAEFEAVDPAPARARVEHGKAVCAPPIELALETADHYAARCGIEARHPLMDKRLVEFCVSLPADQKLRDGWPRSIVRRATAGLLPDEVRWRPSKTRAGENFRRGILDLDRVLLEEALEGHERWFGDLADQRVIDVLRSRVRGADWRDLSALEPRYLFRAAALALWLRDQERKGASLPGRPARDR